MEEGIGGEQPEIVRIARPQSPGHAQRDNGIVHRRTDLFQGARLDGNRQLAAATVDDLELAERDDDEVVLRLAQERSALLAHADDAEVNALNLEILLEGVYAAEETGADPPADDDDRTRAIDFRWAHETTALGVKRRERGQLRAHPVNGGVVDRAI